jgi:hypothetical protein
MTLTEHPFNTVTDLFRCADHLPEPGHLLLGGQFLRPTFKWTNSCQRSKSREVAAIGVDMHADYKQWKIPKHLKTGQPRTLHRTPDGPVYAQVITRFSYNKEQEHQW